MLYLYIFFMAIAKKIAMKRPLSAMAFLSRSLAQTLRIMHPMGSKIPEIDPTGHINLWLLRNPISVNPVHVRTSICDNYEQ